MRGHRLADAELQMGQHLVLWHAPDHVVLVRAGRSALDGAPEASRIGRRDNPLPPAGAPLAGICRAGAILCQRSAALARRNGGRERRSERERACRPAVVGGGINGTGIARDAAGRGLRVLLCEQDDLAAHTSSASSKLIHGGLRYLEQYQFRLVRESLLEREVLLRAAPHIIRPLRFVLPHDREPAAGLADPPRPAPLRPPRRARAAAGLAARSTSRNDPAGEPLKPEFERGFAYADCWVDDARLVALNALDAARARRGDPDPHPLPRGAARQPLWYAELEPTGGGPPFHLRARALVNATGPWVVALPRRAAAARGPEPRPPGQGRPRHRARASTTTPTPTSCRTTTAAWSS